MTGRKRRGREKREGKGRGGPVRLSILGSFYSVRPWDHPLILLCSAAGFLHGVLD